MEWDGRGDLGKPLAKPPEYPEGEAEDHNRQVTCLWPHAESRTRQDLLLDSRSTILPTVPSLGTAEHSCTHQAQILPAPLQLGLGGARRGPVLLQGVYVKPRPRKQKCSSPSPSWLMKSLPWKPVSPPQVRPSPG